MSLIMNQVLEVIVKHSSIGEPEWYSSRVNKLCPWGKSSPLSVFFVNKVLLEHKHAHVLACYDCFPAIIAKLTCYKKARNIYYMGL